MIDINWNRFKLNNVNTQDAFQKMCTHLFCRNLNITGYDFSANYNNTGLEGIPVKVDNKYYGFQCKFVESHNSTSFYDQLWKSLKKALDMSTKTGRDQKKCSLFNEE